MKRTIASLLLAGILAVMAMFGLVYVILACLGLVLGVALMLYGLGLIRQAAEQWADLSRRLDCADQEPAEVSPEPPAVRLASV